MEENFFNIDRLPAVCYGEKSDRVYLFIHGRCGYKEEAADFAKIVCEKGWQVLAIDLPGHGTRKDESDRFTPWDTVPELCLMLKYAKQRWNGIALRACSIGAYFSLLAFADEKFYNCLFVSPVVDMEKLIANMMMFANVTRKELKQKGEIQTSFGETLSEKYLVYAETHRIEKWSSPTAVLYAERDNLTSDETIRGFTDRFSCRLTVCPNGEHWFHTEEQLKTLDRFTDENT